MSCVQLLLCLQSAGGRDVSAVLNACCACSQLEAVMYELCSVVVVLAVSWRL